jgi:hypothetical protein
VNAESRPSGHEWRELASLPGAEEFRMVRAIALLALHGSRARRGGIAPPSTAFAFMPAAMSTGTRMRYVEVNLCVSLGQAIVERCRVVATR